jgi:hypothetical protein
MATRKSTGTTRLEAADDLSTNVGYEKIVRALVLETIEAESRIDSFETLIDTAQKIAIELFINQGAICLKNQRDYMNRDRPLQNIEDYRIFNITSDIMRELTAYDFGVDSNKAIEFLTRQGYEISEGSSTE